MKPTRSRIVSLLLAVAFFSMLSACGGGGSGNSSSTTPTPTGTTTTPVPVAAAITLSTSSTSVASDNSATVTLTAIVTDAANAALPGVTVTFSADTGLLSASSAVSDTTGRATVTFSAGSNATTRTATIVATASGKTAQIPVRVTGSSLTVSAGSTSLTVGAASTTLTVVVKNSGGGVLSGQTVTLSQSGTGSVTFGAQTGTTDASGTFTTSIAPTTAGSVVVTVASVGETRTVSLTVTGVSATSFQISAPSASAGATAATIGTPVTFTVQAPSPTTSVTLVSTLGTWNGGASNFVTLTPTNGSVTATLTATNAGVANVQAFDTSRQATLNDTRTISFTAACTSAARVTLQSNPSVVATNSGGTSSISTLLATVTDIGGNPVGSCPVAFNIVNPTGGGETVSPAVVLTAGVATASAGLGQGTATFTAGSLPSGAPGVQIRAKVVGTSVSTNTSPSGSDATIVIGGTAGSITIGYSTVIQDSASSTLYVLPMSVLVADAGGNPVANATVSLNAWPIAFNTSSIGNSTTACGIDPSKDFLNEDDVYGTSSDSRYENLSLDPGEDGKRIQYPSGNLVAGGTSDGQLTPGNSASGTLPATVTTAANGTATFNLTYTKANALHIIDRITARTLVQGTETRGQLIFRLPASVPDTGPPCLLPGSPYVF